MSHRPFLPGPNATLTGLRRLPDWLLDPPARGEGADVAPQPRAAVGPLSRAASRPASQTLVPQRLSAAVRRRLEDEAMRAVLWVPGPPGSDPAPAPLVELGPPPVRSRADAGGPAPRVSAPAPRVVSTPPPPRRAAHATIRPLAERAAPADDSLDEPPTLDPEAEAFFASAPRAADLAAAEVDRWERRRDLVRALAAGVLAIGLGVVIGLGVLAVGLGVLFSGQ